MRSITPQVLMINLFMSLLRVQDYLHTSSSVHNFYWNELIKTIDQFDYLLQNQKKEISQCLKQHNLKRIQLVRKFYEFKQSLKFQGQVVKKQLQFVEMNEFPTFFYKYHQKIISIIQNIILCPQRLAEFIFNYKDTKKYKCQDFLQNLAFNIYPCYLPSTFSEEDNLNFKFIESIIGLWNYSIQQARPTSYSLLDQVISAYMKTPVIVCYIEKIAGKFITDIANCKMDTFAFDQDAIKNEIDVKKHIAATFSHNNLQKKLSWKDKLKNVFGRGKDDSNMSQIKESVVSYQESFLSRNSQKSQNDYANVSQMMKKRQTSFFQLIKCTTENILNEEVPFLLCKMFQYFHAKIQKMYQKSQISQQNKKSQYLKHHCYFLMTNIIFAQLHSKFTIFHEETGMTHADLQNISQIIRILSCIFQGILPQGDKYKNIKTILPDYRQAVSKYYQKILDNVDNKKQEHNMREMLLKYYSKSMVILSFNDIKFVVEIVLNSKSPNLIDTQETLSFLNDAPTKKLYDPKANVHFKNGVYSAQQLFFIYESHQNNKSSAKETIEKYMMAEQPLQNIPLIKNILLYQSNLTIQESLEIDQDLKLLAKLPIKDIKSYLGKIALKYRHLHVKDGRQLDAKFLQSFRQTLGKTIKKKESLLFYRNEIFMKMNSYLNLMDYYTNQLNSLQFYQRISNSFIDNIRIRIYLSIQQNVWKVHKNPNQLKKLQINSLMVGKQDNLTTKSNQNYILRNSYKLFETVKELLRCLGKNEITKKALQKGRKTQEFNETFKQICEIVVSHIQQFIKKKAILQALSKEKIALIVVKKMQFNLYSRQAQAQLRNRLQGRLDDDIKLVEETKKIDKQLFYEKDLQELGIQREFLINEGVEKFKLIVSQNNIAERIRHFSQFFKIIFTVLGLTMAKNKISAQIVNPIMQYIILECPTIPHYECLYSIQCLKWKETPQDSYNLILYQSSLTYISQMMVNDFKKQSLELKEINMQ